MTEFVLLADLEDIIRIMLVAVPIVIWIGAQLLGDKNKPPADNKPAQPPRPKPQPQRPQNDAFRDEIEAFLKRAAEKRGQPADAQRREAEPLAETAAARRAAEQRAAAARQAAEKRQPLTQRPGPQGPVMAEAVEGPQASPWAGDVAQHVQQHLGTSDFSQRSAQFGQKIDTADDRMVAHLQSVFDHKVGQLDDSPLSAAAAPLTGSARHATPPQAKALIEMLRSKQGVQQAILIGEILKRPQLD